jgi:hypothetical protein
VILSGLGKSASIVYGTVALGQRNCSPDIDILVGDVSLELCNCSIVPNNISPSKTANPFIGEYLTFFAPKVLPEIHPSLAAVEGIICSVELQFMESLSDICTPFYIYYINILFDEAVYIPKKHVYDP